MSRSRLGILIFVVVLLGVFTQPGWAAAIFDFSLDTTGLAGTGRLAFDLTDGDFAINNTATISNFATDGILVGATTNFGGASGNLPGNLTIDDSGFFNSSERDITFGTIITFRVDLTTNFAGGVPDSFAFFLLDPTFFTPLFPTTDVLGGSLFSIDIDGTSFGSLTVYDAFPAIPNVSWTVQAIPEPTSLVLMAIGLLAFAAVGWYRSNRYHAA